MALHSLDSAITGMSICAGYAGLDLGLHIAEPTYRTVCYIEREAHAAATLVARMGDKALDQAPIWDDLKSFDGRPWRDRIHIITAGYPCQPFSFAGKRKGEHDPRHLWPDIARIIDEVQPEWVFAENVEGHLNLGCADVCVSLRRLGYSPKAGLFSAREAGASHRRGRVFILAHADRIGQRSFCRPDDRIGRDSAGQNDQFGASQHGANAARGWTAMWLILKAMGWQAKDIKGPCSHPARVTFWNGNKSLTSTLISNPRFYEMVMGWPTGWTKAEASVTGFAAWLRRSRIALSRLTLVE